MAIGINWGEVWKPVWAEVWAQTQEAPAVETYSGGWARIDRRRKTKEEIRQERIRMGIIQDIPAPIQPEEIPEPISKRRRLYIEPPVGLSQPEIDQIRATIESELDQEIAIHLRAIEKRRRRNIALVMLLDVA